MLVANPNLCCSICFQGLQLPPEEYEDIISMKTSYDQMTELILSLMRKPKEDYNTLCDGLCLEISRTLLNAKTLDAS